MTAYAMIYYLSALARDEAGGIIPLIAVYGGVIVAMIGVAQWSFLWAGQGCEWLPGGRAVGTMGGPPYFGAYLAMILPMAMCLRYSRFPAVAAVVAGLAAR